MSLFDGDGGAGVPFSTCWSLGSSKSWTLPSFDASLPLSLEDCSEGAGDAAYLRLAHAQIGTKTRTCITFTRLNDEQVLPYSYSVLLICEELNNLPRHGGVDGDVNLTPTLVEARYQSLRAHFVSLNCGNLFVSRNRVSDLFRPTLQRSLRY